MPFEEDPMDKVLALADMPQDRASLLAQMYPANQPLSEGDYGQDMMVSLPGQQLGGEFRAGPGESEVLAQSQPFAGPPPERQQVRVTRVPEAQAPAPAPQSKPFDWQRALTAFSGGDVGALDRKRQLEAEAPVRQAMQQAQMAELAERGQERHAKSQELRDSMDPGSELSRAAADDYARSSLAKAELLAKRNPKLAAMFENEAKRAQGKSRAQIAQMAKTSAELMGDFGRMLDRDVRQRMMDSRDADVQADNERADKSLAYKTRPRPPKSTEIKLKMPDSKTVEHYNTRTVALREIDDMLKLLPKVTYTGYGAETANQIMSKLPGKLDARSDADREFVSLLGKLRAKERKDLRRGAVEVRHQ
jgi:hypothetical protein